jgi:predicted ATPase
MSNRLLRLKVKNYRSLADVSVELHALNVLFGPNGAGKSTFLDTIWFVRDCAIRSVELASSARSHGIGILYDGAKEDEDWISISLATAAVEYELRFGLSSGRIEAFAGERLYSMRRNETLIDRSVGNDKASFYHAGMREPVTVTLREPQKLSIGRYLDFDEVEEAAELDRLLHFVHFYHSRSFNFYRLKQQGSEVGYETWLRERGDNLWSVLRNLHDRKVRDHRYDTIMGFMAESFPSFEGLELDQTGPTSVYCNFLEKGRHRPIRASGVADGHLQMLLLLTALFSEGQDRTSIIILDEPEISLHPWALAVLAKAMRLAAEEWNKQIFLATHSPVLVSQFSPEHILSMEVQDGQTRLRRLSEMDEIKDLLEQYAVGSLYMAGVVAAQGPALPSEDGE